MKHEIDEAKRGIESARAETDEIELQLEEKEASKGRNLDRIVYNQKRAKHFTVVAEGKFKPRLKVKHFSLSTAN